MKTSSITQTYHFQESEGYSVWNAVTYRHHQEFVDDLTFNNRKMKQDIEYKEQENDAKQVGAMSDAIRGTTLMQYIKWHIL